MLMKMIRMISAAFLLSSGAASYAQEVIPSEKKDLIKELVVITEATKNAEAVMNSVSDEVQKDVLQLLNQRVDADKSLSAEQREIIQRIASESARRTSQRFRELFNQRVNYPQLVEEVLYEIYSRHYTADELRDLLAFYKSPTGLKTIRIMAQLFSESMAETSKRLMPQVQPIMKEIMDEEMKRMEELLPNKAPRKRRP